MIRSVSLCIFFLVTLLFAEEEVYEFSGKHFFASYMDCNLQKMGDLQGMLKAMDLGVESSGATILGQMPYVFEPNGLTVVYLLSESHASLHTYPEHGACFIDIFTCGDSCTPETIHNVLMEYLEPLRVDARLFLRGEEVKEVAFGQY